MAPAPRRAFGRYPSRLPSGAHHIPGRSQRAVRRPGSPATWPGRVFWVSPGRTPSSCSRFVPTPPWQQADRVIRKDPSPAAAAVPPVRVRVVTAAVSGPRFHGLVPPGRYDSFGGRSPARISAAGLSRRPTGGSPREALVSSPSGLLHDSASGRLPDDPTPACRWPTCNGSFPTPSLSPPRSTFRPPR